MALRSCKASRHRSTINIDEDFDHVSITLMKGFTLNSRGQLDASQVLQSTSCRQSESFKGNISLKCTIEAEELRSLKGEDRRFGGYCLLVGAVGAVSNHSRSQLISAPRLVLPIFSMQSSAHKLFSLSARELFVVVLWSLRPSLALYVLLSEIVHGWSMDSL